MNEQKKQFADSWDIALVVVFITLAVLAYRRSEYLLLSMGALLALLALEAIFKKEIKLWDKAVNREVKPSTYYSIIATYFVGAGICITLQLIL